MPTTQRKLRNNLENIFCLPSHHKLEIRLDTGDSCCFKGRPYTEVVGAGIDSRFEVKWKILGTPETYIGTHILPPFEICVWQTTGYLVLCKEFDPKMMVTIHPSLEEYQSGVQQNRYCPCCLPRDKITDAIVSDVGSRRRPRIEP